MAFANLRRIDALPELRSALLSFRSSTASIPDLVAQRIDRLQRRIDTARSHAESERQAALAQLATRREDDDSNEDDDDALEALRNAEARIEQVSRLAARLHRARSKFEHQTGAWNSVADRVVPKAVQFLQQTIEDANAYLSTHAPGHRGDGQRASQSHADSPSSDAGAHPSVALSPMDLPQLPVGFEWFPIDGFTAIDLPGASDLAKGVAEALIRRGIEILWNEVIPLLQGGPIHEHRARCEQFDREHDRVDRRGFVHPESVAAVWDAFFGTSTSNQIRIELNPAGGRATITNGRHRIRAARELGWRYIPAQVIRKGEGHP